METVLSCDVCGAPSTSRCSRCRGRRYCSRPCQLSDWSKGGHKRACKGSKPAKRASNPTTATTTAAAAAAAAAAAVSMAIGGGTAPHPRLFGDARVELLAGDAGSEDASNRCLVASADFAAGDVVLAAAGLGMVLSDGVANKLCHRCLQDTRGRGHRCGGCAYALYCSAACLELDEVRRVGGAERSTLVLLVARTCPS